MHILDGEKVLKDYCNKEKKKSFLRLLLGDKEVFIMFSYISGVVHRNTSETQVNTPWISLL